MMNLVFWTLVFVALLAIFAGIFLLTHATTRKHSHGDLATLVPFAILTIIGIIHLIDQGIYLSVLHQGGENVVSFNRDSFAGVNIIILSLLWRYTVTAKLTSVQSMKVFVFFVLSYLGLTSFWSLLPEGVRLSAILSKQEPEVFLAAPVRLFLVGLCMEYLLFYIPGFLTMFVLSGKRTSQDETGRFIGMNVVIGESRCRQCRVISPYLDLVTVCLGLMLFVVRPGFLLYYWCNYHLVTDMENTFFILPFYFAICLVHLGATTNKITGPSLSNVHDMALYESQSALLKSDKCGQTLATVAFDGTFWDTKNKS